MSLVRELRRETEQEQTIVKSIQMNELGRMGVSNSGMRHLTEITVIVNLYILKEVNRYSAMGRKK